MATSYVVSYSSPKIADYKRKLRRLGDGPDEVAIREFEGLLEELFLETQEAVHVRTGKLMMSGRTTDNPHRGRSWRGEIKYGGSDFGVKYALYEQNRGGEHDFMEPTYDADDRWAGPIDDFYRRNA